MRYLPLLLIFGCAASGSELRFGVGRSLGSGGGTVTSNLDRTVDEGWRITDTSANTTADIRAQDSTSGWVELMVPLGPRQIEIVNPGLGVMPSDHRPGILDAVSSDVTTPLETPTDAALSDSGGIPWWYATILLPLLTLLDHRVRGAAASLIPRVKKKEKPNGI